MIYNSAVDWQNAVQKRVVLFGMSGLGKTHVSNMLRASGIGFTIPSITALAPATWANSSKIVSTRGDGKSFLRDLLMSDSIKIKSNITFDNLAPLSTYLGKPVARIKGAYPSKNIADVRHNITAPG